MLNSPFSEIEYEAVFVLHPLKETVLSVNETSILLIASIPKDVD